MSGLINSRDPFGLCPPKDKDDGPWCNVAFYGVTASLVLGGGPVVAAGRYESGEGSGWYFRFGAGTGLDVGAGFEVGLSQNFSAFGGDAEGAGGGALGVGYTKTKNSAGSTKSVSYTAGLAVGVHAEKSSTAVSKPKPDDTRPIKRCDVPENSRAACAP